jgi:tetratricopeptide (TPR) repeat protein
MQIEELLMMLLEKNSAAWNGKKWINFNEGKVNYLWINYLASYTIGTTFHVWENGKVVSIVESVDQLIHELKVLIFNRKTIRMILRQVINIQSSELLQLLLEKNSAAWDGNKWIEYNGNFQNSLCIIYQTSFTRGPRFEIWNNGKFVNLVWYVDHLKEELYKIIGGIIDNKQGVNVNDIEYLLEHKAVQEQIFGKKHPRYANLLNRLGIWYANMENHNRAEGCYLTAKEIWEKVQGKNSPNYAITLNNLGLLYYSLGNYNNAAIKCFLELLAIQKMTLGEEHPDYIITFNILEELHRFMEKDS